jgi:hypothetical protein
MNSYASQWKMAGLLQLLLPTLPFGINARWYVMKKWKSTKLAPSPIDIDVTKDCLLPLWLALPPRSAAKLTVSSAEAIDGKLAEAPPELISEIEKLGEKFRLIVVLSFFLGMKIFTD